MTTKSSLDNRKSIAYFIFIYSLINSLAQLSAIPVCIYQYDVFSSDDKPWPIGRPFEEQYAVNVIESILKNAGVQIKRAGPSLTATDIDYLVMFNYPLYPDRELFASRFPKEKKIVILWEPPTVLPKNYLPETHDEYTKIFTMLDDMVDNQRYFKYFYPQNDFRMTTSIPFEEKKIAVFVNSAIRHIQNQPFELYSERLRVIQFFEQNPHLQFDFFGISWPIDFRNYRGVIYGKKQNILKNYRFCFCYENSKNIKGYISEKIFDCFISGCVPIYWGADNITDFIPENCFIDRRKFSSTAEVYEFIAKIGKEEYETYIQNIYTYLQSPEAYYFSLDYFAHTLARQIIPDYLPQMVFDTETGKKIAQLDDALSKYHKHNV